MADSELSALTEDTAPAADDWFYKVDNAGTVDRKTAYSDLLAPSTPKATFPVAYSVAISDQTTAIATTGTKLSFRMPFAMTLTDVRCGLKSACATGTFTVDINEATVSVLSVKLTIDATELTSETAVTGPTISDSALADDAIITIDVDNVGDGTATGAIVTLIGTRVIA